MKFFMGNNLKPVRTLACLGMAVSVLGLAGCASSSHERSEATTQSQADRQLALDVADNLRNAPGTTFPDVAVRANQGQVQLKGFVADEAQKAEAGRIAAQVPGVAGVQNDLAIKPGSAPLGGATAPGGTMQYPQ